MTESHKKIDRYESMRDQETQKSPPKIKVNFRFVSRLNCEMEP